MPRREVTNAELLLVEYQHLKDEQKNRVTFRDNLVYATLASMAAVVAATLSSKNHTDLLLLLPPVSVLLGWTYLVNDEKISAIGTYIREDLAPRLGHLTGEEEPVFRWELTHRSDQRRRTRKLLQLIVDVSTFCGPPLAAVAISLTYGSRETVLVAASIIEIVAVGVLAAQIISYADLRGPAVVK
ncbi:hypothetical protein GA0070610_1045 [Micromonospora echinofusca]|uniref:Integral membrane protein n=1 Tax=Micromonospora echinofusca TaxID=47858 RepID=A0A1C5G4W8_MICEH|nr:hypothetical protein [Micromonospora echinofusca]SCG14827.1 hypothetical protein GA0070610_1045 [Micromonospora echinofusca]